MKILIAGAGTAGLASAALLARNGHEVCVIEAFSALAPVGAGLLIQPSGQHVLKTLGVLASLQHCGSRIDALHGHDRSWRRVLDLDYRDIHSAGLGLHRAHLAETLYQAARSAGASFIWGDVITAFRQDAVGVTVSQLSGNERRADVLVIANGARSQLRGQMAIPYRSTPYPWGALWAICEADDWPSPTILGQVYDGPRKMLGVLPTGQHPVTGRACYSLFWSLPRQEFPQWQTRPFAEWLAELAAYWPALAPLLHSLQREQVAWAEYRDVVMPHWHDGRVVIIGDAAHAMSPQLGQGANLALIDAQCLAQVLMQPRSVTAALADYSVMRKPHLRYYQRASRWLTPLYQSHLPLGTLRDWGTQLSRRLPFMYRQALATLTGHKAGLFSRFEFDN